MGRGGEGWAEKEARRARKRGDWDDIEGEEEVKGGSRSCRGTSGRTDAAVNELTFRFVNSPN